MAFLFQSAGVGVAAVGAWIAWLMWSVPTVGVTAEKLVGITPGLGIVGVGLLFLALGGIMARLDRIARSAEQRGSRGPVLD